MLWTRISKCSTSPCTGRTLSYLNFSMNAQLTRSINRSLIFSTARRSGTRPVSNSSLENSKVEHSQFLANASPHSKWADTAQGNGMTDAEDDELDGIDEGVGKLLPTKSHLFKLILPLDPKGPDDSLMPTVLLLHPSQPLSHVGRLILASLPRQGGKEDPSISFRSSPSNPKQVSRQFQWSDSADIGDFIRDAARAAEFHIHIIPNSQSDEAEEKKQQIISVRVPTFADRTRFLRRRLDMLNTQLNSMEGLKRECDREARRGARRMALGGFGMLVVYWAAVARLTFWDYGWDVMEPITYLSGLSTVICGYLWFLYRGREVSYSSVLASSVSARQDTLYKQRGLDIEKWIELISERKHLMKEIGQIKEDYEQPSGDRERPGKGEETDDDDKDLVTEREKSKGPLSEPEDEAKDKSR